MDYYSGGYYLIKKRPIDFGADIGKTVSTCSRCINFSIYDSWCTPWMNDKLDKADQQALRLTDQNMEAIQQWVEQNMSDSFNVFPDLATAHEFKALFFEDKNDIEVYGIYFSVTDAESLIHAFAEGENLTTFNYNNGYFGLRKNLLKKIKEKNDQLATFMGYDFIGVECDGSFHSFYCHDITNTLIGRFGLTLTVNGLFDDPIEATAIRTYLNDPATGLEPVPWYIVKIKKYDP
jgi:hypothetical protein